LLKYDGQESIWIPAMERQALLCSKIQETMLLKIRAYPLRLCSTYSKPILWCSRKPKFSARISLTIWYSFQDGTATSAFLAIRRVRTHSRAARLASDSVQAILASLSTRDNRSALPLALKKASLASSAHQTPLRASQTCRKSSKSVDTLHPHS